MQLILAGIFQLDVPTGNIPLAVGAGAGARSIDRRRGPDFARRQLSRFPDRWDDARITSTSTMASLPRGACGPTKWRRCSARRSPRTPARRRRSLRRLAWLGRGRAVHGDSVYTVVGVLKPTGTVLDRLVLVNTESVWFVHEGRVDRSRGTKVVEDERQITVLARAIRDAARRGSLPRKINTETNMQAASPAYESARLVSHDRRGRRCHPGVRRRRAGHGGVVALHRAVSRPQRAGV